MGGNGETTDIRSLNDTSKIQEEQGDIEERRGNRNNMGQVRTE